jgi:hypothetical protein
LLFSNPDVCNTMTEVREHVKQYGKRLSVCPTCRRVY